MSLKQIVGQKTYSVWIEMLQQLVPEGRTHRLAPLVAGMLQYASDMAYQKYGGKPAEGSAAQVLFMASEVYDPAEAEELSELVEQLFARAMALFYTSSGGAPAKGPRGGDGARRGAPCGGGGGGARRGAWGGSPKRLYKAATDYTEPQQTIESPRKTIQSPNRLYKASTDNTKPRNIR